MIPSTLRLSLLAVLLGSALAAHATSITYTLTPGRTVTIPAFDPSLGTLTSVQTNSSASGKAIFSGPGGCISRLSLTPSGSSSHFSYTHFCQVAYDYSSGGGFKPSLNASGDVFFHDTSSIGLPLDWGLRGMVASWDSGRLGVTGSVLYNLGGQYQIQLTYSPVPEPAPLAVLGFGAVALLRRRIRARGL